MVLLFYLACVCVLTTSVSFFGIVGGPSAKFQKWIDIGNAKLG